MSMNIPRADLGSKRSPRQSLPGSGFLPQGHTNRSTESCGTSVNSNSPVNRWKGHHYSKPSHRRLNPTVVPRDREERAFVCLDERLYDVKSSGLCERLVSIVRSGARLSALIPAPPICHYAIRRTSP